MRNCCITTGTSCGAPITSRASSVPGNTPMRSAPTMRSLSWSSPITWVASTPARRWTSWWRRSAPSPTSFRANSQVLSYMDGCLSLPGGPIWRRCFLPSEPMQRLTRTGCCASNPCGMVSPAPSRRIESFGAIRSPMRARSPRCQCWSTNISKGPKK